MTSESSAVAKVICFMHGFRWIPTLVRLSCHQTTSCRYKQVLKHCLESIIIRLLDLDINWKFRTSITSMSSDFALFWWVTFKIRILWLNSRSKEWWILLQMIFEDLTSAQLLEQHTAPAQRHGFKLDVRLESYIQREGMEYVVLMRKPRYQVLYWLQIYRH